MQNKQSELQCTLQVQATPRPVLWRRLQHPTVSPHLSPSISKDPRVIKDRVGRVASGAFVAGGVIYLFISSRNNVRVSN